MVSSFRIEKLLRSSVFASSRIILQSKNLNNNGTEDRKNSFPCSVQTSMAPNFDELPQFLDKNPPPYNFYVLRENGDPVKYYNQEAYTIKINGSVYFRQFLIQARLSNKNGTLTSNIRAGEFVYNAFEWSKQGVQVLQCPSVLNDSITHSNGDKKSSIEVKWITKRNEGPIQFLVTIVQEKSMFWVQWSPKSGLIVPSKDSKFSGFVVPLKKKIQDIYRNEVRFLSPSHVSDIEKNKNNALEGLTEEEKEALFLINQHRQTDAITTPIVPVSLHPDLKLAPVNINIKPQSVTPGSSSTKEKEKTTKQIVDNSTKSTHIVLTSTTTKIPVTHATSHRTTTTATPNPITNQSRSEEVTNTDWTTSTEVVATTSEESDATENVTGDDEESSGEESNSTNFSDFPDQTTVDFSMNLNGTEALKFSNHTNQTKEDKFRSTTIKSMKHTSNETVDVKKTTKSKSFSNESIEHQASMKNVSNDHKNGSIEAKNVSRLDNLGNNTHFNSSKQFEHENVSHSGMFGNETHFNSSMNLEHENVSHSSKVGDKSQLSKSMETEHEKNVSQSDKLKNSTHFNATVEIKHGNGTHEIDECSSNPCMNNATCTVTKPGVIKCQCLDGYMGSKCQRPCQDNYLSCVSWQEEDKCAQRSVTKFYDINCAATCGQCVYVNLTVRTDNPLPPVLEPFHNLLGTWTVNTSNSKRYPLDFPDAPKGYYEELSFFITTLPVFGTPSINYTALAVNNADPTDAQTNVGFMTLKPFTEPTNVSIISTGNDGITIIEEGLLYNGHEMNLIGDIFYAKPTIESKSLSTLRRNFNFDGDILEETVQRIGFNGESDSFHKTYKKLNQYIVY